MNIKVCEKDYDIDEKVNNLLDTLFFIKKHMNHSLAFRSGCRSGVCGSCAVKVNGVETLSCKTKIKQDDVVEPLSNCEVIKDLIVDIDYQEKFLKTSKSFLENKNDVEITIKDEKLIDIESNCILCRSCFSSCPVYSINENFLGPFALTRVYRYVNDKKESDIKNKIEAVQTNGIWDCTLCGNCNMVCPEHINIKDDILQLRNKSAMLGYNDPNINSFNNSFDFGFNPNGF